jgi:carboxylesterase
VGVLLLHGFTGAPREVRPVGEVLAANGYTVLGPRLAHHGTRIEDMFRSHWQDWYYSALDGYHLLSGHCETVIAGGLSMGGVLSLYLAAHHPVAAVFTMSSPLKPLLDSMDWRARYAGALGYLMPFSPKGPPSPGSDPDHVGYARNPVRAVAQLRALLQATTDVLPRVTAPALVVHSRGDTGVPAENLDYIYDHLGSSEKDKLWLERSGHIVTEGPERQQLLDRVLAFVNTHARRPRPLAPGEARPAP